VSSFDDAFDYLTKFYKKTSRRSSRPSTGEIDLTGESDGEIGKDGEFGEDALPASQASVDDARMGLAAGLTCMWRRSDDRSS
jgi:hypothetical protein